MKLSVIIALYNTREYIEKTIMSVINSSLEYDEYEIIVVNDGSTDGSENVVLTLIDKYSNIILINKENGGQSSARNIGFKEAKGRYILCLDSDDYIESSSLKDELYYLIDKDVDIYAYSFFREYDQKTIISHASPIIDVPMKCEDFLNNYVLHGAMCMYFYKTEIIHKYNLKLIEGVFLEDEEFVLKFMLFSDSILNRQALLYHYVQRQNSSTQAVSKSHKLRLLTDLVTVISNIARLENLKLSDKQYSGLIKKKEQLISSIFLKALSSNIAYMDFQIVLNKMKEINLYPCKIKYNSYKFKLASLIFNNCTLLKLMINIRNKWN